MELTLAREYSHWLRQVSAVRDARILDPSIRGVPGNHQDWYRVFCSLDPEECLQQILNFLPPRSVDWVKYVRPGSRQVVYLRHLWRAKPRDHHLWALLFPDPRPLAILKRWFTAAVPKGYFLFFNVSCGDRVFDLKTARPTVVEWSRVRTVTSVVTDGRAQEADHGHVTDASHNAIPRWHKMNRRSHRPKPLDWNRRWNFRAWLTRVAPFELDGDIDLLALLWHA
ncbi:MAG: hypothetical protein HYY50_00080 [Candidatus Kerfeldbacteria bacterium]|nr:hypothetical protein [Candidatus Kerfeldbacteria bacterium]